MNKIPEIQELITKFIPFNASEIKNKEYLKLIN